MEHWPVQACFMFSLKENQQAPQQSANNLAILCATPIPHLPHPPDDDQDDNEDCGV